MERGKYFSSVHRDEEEMREAIETGHAWAALMVMASRETNDQKLAEMEKELDRMLQGSRYLQGVFETFQTSFQGVRAFNPLLGNVLTFLANRQSRPDDWNGVMVQRGIVPVQFEAGNMSDRVGKELICA